METGFTLDQASSSIQTATWHKGEPNRSFWLGGVRTNKAHQVEIVTLRCTRCGFLEHYAPGK